MFQIAKNRVEANIGRRREHVRNRNQSRLVDLVRHPGTTTETVSLPPLSIADCDTYRSAQSLDAATGAPPQDEYVHIPSTIATKSTPDVATQHEDVVQLSSNIATKSSPDVSEFTSEQIHAHGKHEMLDCNNILCTYCAHELTEKENVNVHSYIVRYPVLGIDQGVLNFTPWQTCSIQCHLNFYGKHSATVKISGKG